MIGTLPPSTQAIKNTNWKETQCDGYRLQCLRGQLIRSTIWIREENHLEKNRHCSIVLKVDEPCIYPTLDRSLRAACDEVRSLMAFPGLPTDHYIFDIRVNDKQSEKFLDCINLMGKFSPMSKEAISILSKLVAGYAVAGNAQINFLPLFGFLMAMNSRDIFPKEITNFIGQLFIQGTGIEFAQGNSEGFYKEFAAKALQRPVNDMKSAKALSNVKANDRGGERFSKESNLKNAANVSTKNNASGRRPVKANNDRSCVLF